jgi:predicted  nucleic acid-binding Zn-ribbon protein
MDMNRKSKIYGLLLLCLLAAETAAAPKPESAGQQALKKAQGVVRQLTEEKQALEAEKTALQEQIKKLEIVAKQIEPLQGEILLHKTQEDNLRTVNGGLETQLQREREKQQDLHRKMKEIVAQAKQIQNDNQLLVSAVSERERWIKQCTEKNAGLVEANRAIIGKYEHKGFWDKVGELEPFTGLAKVETQNTVETYQFKLEDLKVTDFAEEKGK